MKRILKSLLLCCAASLLAGLAAPAESAGQTNAAAAAKAPINLEQLFGNTLVAKGKNISVTRAQLDEEVIRVKTTAAGVGQPLPPDLEQRVLEGLINRQLLLAKATDADKVKGKAQFEASLQKFKTNAKLNDEEFDQKLNQQLQVQGLTRKQWQEENVEKATIPVVLERELKINVTDEEAKKFYDENPAYFEQPEMVRVSHILLSTKDPADSAPDPALQKDLPDEKKQAKHKQMEDLLRRARAGEDFTKLVKEFSESPGAKQNNGEVTFSRDDRSIPPEFKAAAFALTNTNQISDIVTTVYGYHIIRLEEKIPAKKEALAKVSADLKEYLAQQALEKQMPKDYLEKLQKEAGVEILDEKLKPAETPVGSGTNSAAKTEIK